jgi:hypothetical protein
MVFLASVAMALGLVLALVPGATPKKPASGLMARSWDHHGEVGLAAGGREGGGDVGLLGGAVGALGGFDAEDEHVLGHPALVAGDVGGDAQGEALLAEEGVAAVAATIAPDLACLGEVDDVLLVVAGPGDVLLAGCEGCADGVHAGDDTLDVLVDLGEDGRADAGHDAHVDYGVGGVGELDADLRHGRADGAHAEGKDVHGSPAHAAAEELLELAPHDEGVFPVVGGAGVVFGQGADEGAVFDPGDIVGRGAGVEATWPQLLVQPGEGACLDEPVAEVVVLGLGAVDPVDRGWLAQVCHLFYPADQMLVCSWRRLSDTTHSFYHLGYQWRSKPVEANFFSLLRQCAVGKAFQRHSL